MKKEYIVIRFINKDFIMSKFSTKEEVFSYCSNMLNVRYKIYERLTSFNPSDEHELKFIMEVNT